MTNTFYGTGAGANTTSGLYDSAFGYFAFNFNTTGSYNTASGYGSGQALNRPGDGSG